MRPFLDGVATFRIESGSDVLYDEETRFGSADARIAFRDKVRDPDHDRQVGADPATLHRARRAVSIEQMVEVTEEIIAILAEECGVHAWIAFGTLLGAARSGEVIGHDSDIDLAYVSNQSTPAAMAVEMYDDDPCPAPARHEGAAEERVVHHGRLPGSRRRQRQHRHLHLPLRRRPAPRDRHGTCPQCRVRRSSHSGRWCSRGGRSRRRPTPRPCWSPRTDPDWRTPDPSFKHEPGPEILRRFDGWFGSLMRNRRDWERTLRLAREADGLVVSDFAHWVRSRLSRPDLGRGGRRRPGSRRAPPRVRRDTG